MARILVIDDEKSIRNILRVALEREGYEVDEAEDGHVGLERYRSSTPDLIITDIVMPEREGLETIRTVLQSTPGAKIIAISGGGRLGPDGYLRLAQDFGAKKAFSKPFKIPDLLAAVKELLEEP